ncbi:MAG: hypothetical protein ACTSU7_09930 [Candidatus Heimdallarchaeaceae archaeon]
MKKIISIILMFAISMTMLASAVEIDNPEAERIIVNENDFVIMVSGNDLEVPVIDGEWFFLNNWQFKALEFDSRDIMTLTPISRKKIGLKVTDTRNEAERLIPVTVCIYSEVDLIHNEEIIIPDNQDRKSPFCPDASRSYHEFTQVNSEEQIILTFSESPKYVEFWTGEGAGGGGIPTCDGMALGINNSATGGNVTFDFNMSLFGDAYGATTFGCSIDEIWWQSNQSGGWASIPASSVYVLRYLSGGCPRTGCNIDTWYDMNVECDENGEYYVRGKMQYDENTNFNQITYSQVRKITCFSNETESRQAIIEGINNTITNATTYYDQQVYIHFPDDSQSNEVIDVVTQEGNQAWLFSYFSPGDPVYSLFNLLYTVFTWENHSLTNNEITAQVEEIISNNME